MPNHTTGPCGLGDRCSGRGFEIRAKYKCCFGGFQLHNPLSGCSRTHGEDDDKVKCVDAMKCLQRNSASGRCASQPQGSDTLNSKRGGVQVGTARGAGSQQKDDDNGIERSGDEAGGKKRSLPSDQREPSKNRGDTRRVVMKGKIVVLIPFSFSIQSHPLPIHYIAQSLHTSDPSSFPDNLYHLS